jgi:hypothetical protein
MQERQILVQRYEAYEHAGSGDKAAGSSKFTIGQPPNEVELTSGEVNALADLYGTLDDLKKADHTELLKLRELVRQQQRDPKSVSEKAWDEASGGRYTKLNLANSPHFAPSRKPAGSGSPGPDNRSTWRSYYRAALAQAHECQRLRHIGEAATDTVIQNQALAEADLAMQEARLQNSFGEHYLMDAFSAGHLFSKEDALDAMQAKLNNLSKDALAQLFNSVAAAVWASQSATISGYQGRAYWAWWDLNSADRFKSVLEGVYEDEEGKEALKSSVVKAAHDKLDTDGVQVKNAFAPWLLKGDKTLASSPDTQHWINEALEAGRKSLEIVATTLVGAPDDQLIAEIERYLPEPTAPAAKMIEDLVASVTDPKGTMADSIAAVASREIDALLSAIKDKKKIRKKP